VGVTEIDTTFVAVTETCADADIEESATLVAVTVYVPAEEGAV
jgi:hypothetical protein